MSQAWGGPNTNAKSVSLVWHLEAQMKGYLSNFNLDMDHGLAFDFIQYKTKNALKGFYVGLVFRI